MRAPGVVMGLLVLAAMVGLAGFFLFGQYKTNPLDPGVPPLDPASTSPPSTTATTTTTATPPPSTSASPSTSTNPSGNGTDGDRTPTPALGSVLFTFTLPKGIAPQAKMELVALSPGVSTYSRARWIRSVAVRAVRGGRYEARFPGLAEGQQELWLDIPGVGTAGLCTVAAVADTATAHDLGEIMPPVDVTVMAVDPLTADLLDFAATLAPAGGAEGRHARNLTLSQTRSRGRCLPGRYLLSVRSPGRAPLLKLVEIGATTPLITAEMAAPARLRIRVTNADGEPSGTLFIQLRRADGVVFRTAPDAAGVPRNLATAGGLLDLAAAPAGRWTVEASRHRGGVYSALGDAVIAAGATTGLSFTYRD